MRMSAVAAGLVSDLEALGRLGDEATRDAAARLAAALPGTLSARLVQIVSELAAELDATLEQARAEVRLTGDDATIVVSRDEPPAGVATDRAPEYGMAGDSGDGGEARLTLRLPAGLKLRLEHDAAVEGLSLNGYLVRLLGRSPSGRTSRSAGGLRMSGYGRS